MNDHDLDERLERAGAHYRDAPLDAPALDLALDEALTDISRPARAPWARRHWLTVAAVVGVVALAVGLSLFATAPHRSTKPAEPSTPTNPYDTLVLHDGDTVRITADAQAFPGKPVRLCAPRARTFEYIAGATPKECPGITAVGVDLAGLLNRTVRSGVIEGQATFVGVYRRLTLTVTRQTPTVDTGGSRTMPTEPPCAPPDGGWPADSAFRPGDQDAMTAWGDAHPGAVLVNLTVSPKAGHGVRVIVVGADQDPVQVRSVFEQWFRGRLCVTQSRYTHTEVQRAMAAFLRYLTKEFPHPVTGDHIQSVGPSFSARIEAQVDVTVDFMTPGMAQLAAAQPQGLVQVTTWITPVQRAGG